MILEVVVNVDTHLGYPVKLIPTQDSIKKKKLRYGKTIVQNLGLFLHFKKYCFCIAVLLSLNFRNFKVFKL